MTVYSQSFDAKEKSTDSLAHPHLIQSFGIRFFGYGLN